MIVTGVNCWENYVLRLNPLNWKQTLLFVGQAFVRGAEISKKNCLNSSHSIYMQHQAIQQSSKYFHTTHGKAIKMAA